MDATYWLVLFVVMLIIELSSVELTTIWLVAVVLVAFIASAFNASNRIQWILFGIVSIVLLVLARPLAKKYLCSRQEKTNTDKATKSLQKGE